MIGGAATMRGREEEVSLGRLLTGHTAHWLSVGGDTNNDWSKMCPQSSVRLCAQKHCLSLRFDVSLGAGRHKTELARPQGHRFGSRPDPYFT
jgi:hypothetical protein